MGMAQEALVEYEQAMTVDKTSAEFVRTLRKAFEKQGWKGYWEKTLSAQREKSRNEYVSPYKIANYYVLLGDGQNTFRSLDKAYAIHYVALTDIKTERNFDPLDADPRYATTTMNLRPCRDKALRWKCPAFPRQDAILTHPLSDTFRA
jgi:hypothetical protein